VAFAVHLDPAAVVLATSGEVVAFEALGAAWQRACARLGERMPTVRRSWSLVSSGHALGSSPAMPRSRPQHGTTDVARPLRSARPSSSTCPTEANSFPSCNGLGAFYVNAIRQSEHRIRRGYSSNYRDPSTHECRGRTTSLEARLRRSVAANRAALHRPRRGAGDVRRAAHR